MGQLAAALHASDADLLTQWFSGVSQELGDEAELDLLLDQFYSFLGRPGLACGLVSGARPLVLSREIDPLKYQSNGGCDSQLERRGCVDRARVLHHPSSL